MTTTPATQADILRPIIGIENRTAQEVFDIMCDRFRHRQTHSLPGDVGDHADIADKIIAAVKADDDCRGRGKFEVMQILATLTPSAPEPVQKVHELPSALSSGWTDEFRTLVAAAIAVVQQADALDEMAIPALSSLRAALAADFPIGSALSGDAGEGLTDNLERWGDRVAAWIKEFGFDVLESELCASRNTLDKWASGNAMPRPFARQGLVRAINEFRAALPSHKGAGE